MHKFSKYIPSNGALIHYPKQSLFSQLSLSLVFLPFLFYPAILFFQINKSYTFG